MPGHNLSGVHNAVQIFCHLGLELIKVDLKDTYRVIPVHTQNHHRLGIQSCGDMFVDWGPPFGLWSTPRFSLPFPIWWRVQSIIGAYATCCII